MKLGGFIILSLCMLASISCNDASTISLCNANRNDVFVSDDYYTWGASPVLGMDGNYHLFYSRWPRSLGFNAWVTHSEVAHAVSSKPEGPYEFSDVALPARGAEFWDGLDTHNPTIHLFDGKYYLYYTGNTGNGVSVRNELNAVHRNNQRIGVAVSESPYGPWKRMDNPLIDVSRDSLSYDTKMVSNPSVTRMNDGRYLMIYKAVASFKGGVWGGPVVHLCAIADSPEGPFHKIGIPVFTCEGSKFPAEDPYIWNYRGRYFAIVKDMHGSFTGCGRSLALFESEDGLDWKPSGNPLVSVPEIRWNDGTTTELSHLERPQLLFKKGRPVMIFLAADRIDDYGAEGTNTFNIHIKIK